MLVSPWHSPLCSLSLTIFCLIRVFVAVTPLCSVAGLMSVWWGCPFHLLFYDPAVVKSFKAIIVINSYANTLHLTLWTQNLKFDLTKAFQKYWSMSWYMHASLREGPAHGFSPELSHRACLLWTGCRQKPLTCSATEAALRTALRLYIVGSPFKELWISGSELRVLMAKWHVMMACPAVHQSH